MQMLPDIELQLFELLQDDDYLVRAEAARALAVSDSPSVLEALRHATHDRHAAVQHAARASLVEIVRRTGIVPLVADAKEARGVIAR
jgi:HEAT repeat protein